MGLSAFNLMRARLAKKKAEEEKSKSEQKRIEAQTALEPVKEPVLTPKAEPVEVQPEVVKAEKKEPVKKTDAQKLRRKKG